jgi:Na+/H+ antiporter NhaC
VLNVFFLNVFTKKNKSRFFKIYKKIKNIKNNNWTAMPDTIVIYITYFVREWKFSSKKNKNREQKQKPRKGTRRLNHSNQSHQNRLYIYIYIGAWYKKSYSKELV